MKSFLFLLFLSAASLVDAQNLKGLPTCAKDCNVSTIAATGCETADWKCICNNDTWRQDSLACSQKDCDEADAQKFQEVYQKLCATFPQNTTTTSTTPTARLRAVPSTSSSLLPPPTTITTEKASTQSSTSTHSTLHASSTRTTSRSSTPSLTPSSTPSSTPSLTPSPIPSAESAPANLVSDPINPTTSNLANQEKPTSAPTASPQPSTNPISMPATIAIAVGGSITGLLLGALGILWCIRYHRRRHEQPPPKCIETASASSSRIELHAESRNWVRKEPNPPPPTVNAFAPPRQQEPPAEERRPRGHQQQQHPEGYGEQRLGTRVVPTSPEEDLPRGIDDVRQVQQQVGYDREELHYAPRGAVNTPPEVRGDRIYEQQQQRGYGFRRRQEEIDLRVLVGDELLHQRPGVGNFEGLYSTSTPQAAPSPVAVAYMQETMYDRGR